MHKTASKLITHLHTHIQQHARQPPDIAVRRATRTGWCCMVMHMIARTQHITPPTASQPFIKYFMVQSDAVKSSLSLYLPLSGPKEDRIPRNAMSIAKMTIIATPNAIAGDHSAPQSSTSSVESLIPSRSETERAHK